MGAISIKGRHSPSQPSHDRQRKIEKRHNQDRQRKDDWQESGKKLGGVHCAGIDLSGHGYRADRHHQAYKQSARIAEEELRGVPIPGQEPNERSRQQDGQNDVAPPALVVREVRVVEEQGWPEP